MPSLILTLISKAASLGVALFVNATLIGVPTPVSPEPAVMELDRLHFRASLIRLLRVSLMTRLFGVQCARQIFICRDCPYPLRRKALYFWSRAGVKSLLDLTRRMRFPAGFQHLDNADIDWLAGVLTIRNTKSGKARHVPGHAPPLLP